MRREKRKEDALLKRNKPNKQNKGMELSGVRGMAGEGMLPALSCPCL